MNKNNMHQTGFRLPIVDFESMMAHKTVFRFGDDEQTLTYAEVFRLLHEHPSALISIGLRENPERILNVVFPLGFITFSPFQNKQTYWIKELESSFYGTRDVNGEPGPITLGYEELMRDATSIPIYSAEIHQLIMDKGVEDEEVEAALMEDLNQPEFKGFEMREGWSIVDEVDPKIQVSIDQWSVSKEAPFVKSFVKAGTVVDLSILEESTLFDTEEERDAEYDRLVKEHEEVNN